MKCKKKFLYEVTSPGLLYLTLDDCDPIYIEFQQRLKLELCAVPGPRFKGLSVTLESPTANQKDKIKVTCGESAASEKTIIQEKAKTTRGENPFLEKIMSLPVTKEMCRDSTKRKHENNSDIRYLSGENTKSRVSLQFDKEKRIDSGKKIIISRVESGVENVEGAEGDQLKGQNEREEYSSKHADVDKMAKPLTQGENRMYAQLEKDSEKGEFMCPCCKKGFSTKLGLKQHTKIASSHSYKCAVCKSTFPFRALCLIHMKKHKQVSDRAPQSVCDECGEDTGSRVNLKRHMFAHTKEFVYQCCLCEKKALTLKVFMHHQASHLRVGKFRCTCCGENFWTRTALTNHKMTVMNVKCSVCDKDFPNRTSRNLHMKVEHSDQMVSCKLCSHTQLFSPVDLLKHMEQHKRHKRKQCGICGVFVSRLDKHRLVHSRARDPQGPDYRPYMCDLCPKTFRRSDTLAHHMQTHSPEKSYKCHLCNKMFGTRASLRKHLKTHSGLMPFECEICGKRCLERSNLKTHMRVHSAINVYHCQVCSQGFKYKSSLDSHMRSKHSQRIADVAPILKHENPGPAFTDKTEYNETEISRQLSNLPHSRKLYSQEK